MSQCLRHPTLLTLALVLTLIALAPLAQAESPQSSPSPAPSPSPSQGVTLEAIDGAESVILVDSAQKELTASKGDTVPSGTRVKLRPGSQATLLYADGTRVTLSNDAEFEPGEKKDGLQSSALRSGKAKTSIPRPLTPAEKIEGAKRKIQFLIRTKSAVIGVRGTVFETLIQTAEAARVETAEGVVEVAKDEATLLTTGGTEVPAGHFVTATPEGITAPQAVSSAAPGGSSAAAPAGLPATPAPAGTADPAAAAGAAQAAKHMMPSLHLFAFEAGALFSPDPSAGPLDSPKASPFVAWKPGIGLPKLDFVRLRAHIGLAKRDGTLIREAGAFLTVHAIGLAFGELGWGTQSWGDRPVSGSTFTMNAGLLTGGVFFDRLFVGRTTLSAAQGTVTQWRAGIGFHF